MLMKTIQPEYLCSTYLDNITSFYKHYLKTLFNLNTLYIKKIKLKLIMESTLYIYIASYIT
jgi:hypothetical protein